jgi:hypothetical protein
MFVCVARLPQSHQNGLKKKLMMQISYTFTALKKCCIEKYAYCMEKYIYCIYSTCIFYRSVLVLKLHAK